jgi:hypothetical protein
MSTPMPTAAKLMAAVSFAVVGWIIANAYVPNMPEAQAVGLFREGVAFLGAIIGWRVMGPSAGRGYVEAVGSGIKTVVLLVFFALLLFSIYEMLMNSVKMRYDGPMEAALDVLMTMVRRSEALLSLSVIGSMLIGGAVGGLLSENAGRRWR